MMLPSWLKQAEQGKTDTHGAGRHTEMGGKRALVLYAASPQLLNHRAWHQEATSEVVTNVFGAPLCGFVGIRTAIQHVNEAYQKVVLKK